MLPAPLLISILTLFHVPFTVSAPLSIFGSRDDENKTPPTPFSLSDLETQFLRPAQFSRVAYCSSAAVTSWQCGSPCDEIGKGVKVIQAGGDDGLIPMYFVAHDPTTNSIIVAHQGTNSKNLLSILNDAQFLLKPLNSTRFQFSGDVKVHDGFQKTFERTADGVLDGVQKGLNDFNATKVLVTGHSLGAAIATFDSLMLKQKLPSTVELKTTVFGMPRSGNKAFADFVDSTLSTTDGVYTRITNQDDPVPRVPPQAFGFQHASGEIHIGDAAGDKITKCPGQDNESEGCSSGNGVLSVLKLDVPDHKGPYFDGISFAASACPA
ncbi:alpha/beta-hydrolase [Marasmius fiardii PR-910]|nr:alpha/beta-hydrolase [Marasmius fiardii PR-910]